MSNTGGSSQACIVWVLTMLFVEYD